MGGAVSFIPNTFVKAHCPTAQNTNGHATTVASGSPTTPAGNGIDRNLMIAAAAIGLVVIAIIAVAIVFIIRRRRRAAAPVAMLDVTSSLDNEPEPFDDDFVDDNF